MSRKLFLDVGAHTGGSSATALHAELAFDVVHAFEPDPECAAQIEGSLAADIAAGRLIVHRAALGGADGEITLYGDNAGGGASMIAGMLRDERRAIRAAKIDVARFLDTHVGSEDVVYVKLNCEGAEVEILDRLWRSARIQAVRSIMADFDIVKSSRGYFQKRRIVRLYRAKRLPLSLSEAVMVGPTHAERIRNWLAYHPDVWRTRPAATPAARATTALPHQGSAQRSQRTIVRLSLKRTATPGREAISPQLVRSRPPSSPPPRRSGRGRRRGSR